MENFDLLDAGSAAISEAAQGNISSLLGSADPTGLNGLSTKHEGVGLSLANQLNDVAITGRTSLAGSSRDRTVDLALAGDLFGHQTLVQNTLKLGGLIGKPSGGSSGGSSDGDPLLGKLVQPTTTDTLTGTSSFSTAAKAITTSYTERAQELWRSGQTKDARTLADRLWDEGATQAEIGQALKKIGFGLTSIADAMDDGVTKSDGSSLNYISTAVALSSSGHQPTARQVADLLWDEGATETEIGQALKYIGHDLSAIADALDDGVTKSKGVGLSYTSVAKGLWNSGHKIGSRQLADLLWDEGATQAEIGQALNYAIGRNLGEIASDIKNGVTQKDGKPLNTLSIATALWNSGLAINTQKLADVLWDSGTSPAEIGQALRYVADRNLTQIASDIKYGVTKKDGKPLNALSIATALWNSGYKPTIRQVADVLWDNGASQAEIGQALKHLGASLTTIADAVDDGVTTHGSATLNYVDTAIALYNSGHKPSARQIADLLWDEGASQTQIGQALKQLGFGTTSIADAINDGVTTSIGQSLGYTDTAVALWNSGHKMNPQTLANALWKEGASQAQIGQALKHLGFDLATIADAVDDGVWVSPTKTMNYIDTAIALWHSGHKPSARKIADLLWDEGASQAAVGQALKHLGFGLITIADAVDDGISNGNASLNYADTAIALWHSGHKPSARKIADLLWKEGATATEIGQALKAVGFGLTTLADAVADGVRKADGTGLNHYSLAQSLWRSGYQINTRQLADLLWKEGTSQIKMGQALRSLGISKEGIADAMADGSIGFNSKDVAIAVWNSGHGMSAYGLAKVLRDEGFGRDDSASSVSSVTGANYYRVWLDIGVIDFKDWVNDASQQVRAVAQKADTFYNDNKSTLSVVASPLVLAVESGKTIAKSLETGDVDPIVDALKRIPVAGTAVAAVEGVIKAIEGDEKEVLKSAIDSALIFYGANTVITSKMVDFAVDILWELKDSDYKGAVSETLKNLGLEQKVSEVFVSVAWALEQGSWEKAVDSALTAVGFENPKALADIAWDIVDNDYQGALYAALDLVGFESLKLDRAKADGLINTTVAIRQGNYSQAADHLLALAGPQAQQLAQSDWVRDLQDGDSSNDQRAVQNGLTALGFESVSQWVDTIWAVKEGQYLEALSEIFTLGEFQDAEAWLGIIGNLKAENYLNALTTAFELAGFEEGQALAEAAIAVRDGKPAQAFYESFDLVPGGGALKDAFQALQSSDLQDFVNSMISATPLLVKLL